MANNVTILGAGAFGLALAHVLNRRGNNVTIWDRNPEILDRLRTTGNRGNLGGFVLDSAVTYEADLLAAVESAQFLVSAVPSFASRSILERLKAMPGGLGNRLYISVCKGIEQETLMLPSQVFSDVMGPALMNQYVVLAGPSHAEEIVRNIPTLVVSCSQNPDAAGRVQELFMLPEFRVYTSTDVTGVELGGALKNVVAIAAGACDGLGYGDNTKAALITRAVAEIGRAAAALGANPKTLGGLSGLGDLVVTTTSRHSRNRLFGELIARGRSPQEALQEVGAVVEGYRTAKSAHDLSRKFSVEMPLADAIYNLLYQGASMEGVIRGLLLRDPRPELDQK